MTRVLRNYMQEGVYSQSSAYSRLRTTSVLALSLFVAIEVAEGPVLWSLDLLGLEWLAYLPKLVLGLCVVAHMVARPRISHVGLGITGLFVLFALTGQLLLSNPLQSLLGAWIWLPLIAGFWLSEYIRLPELLTVVRAFFIAAISGLALDVVLTLPWEGLKVEVMGYSLLASRQWTALGVERYAGLSGASYHLAAQLLVLGTILATVSTRKVLRVLWWVLAGTAIVVTTSKGVLAAWFVLTIFFSSRAVFRGSQAWNQFGAILLFILMSSMALVPLSTLWIQYSISLETWLTRFLFSSFGERLTTVWPQAFELLSIEGSWTWLTGRGLGGIGSAQAIYETFHTNPADNLFIYFMVTLGLPVAAVILIAISSKAVLILRGRRYAPIVLPLMLICVTCGLVSNVVEEPLFALALGYSLVSAPLKVSPLSKWDGLGP